MALLGDRDDMLAAEGEGGEFMKNMFAGVMRSEVQDYGITGQVTLVPYTMEKI